MFGVIWLVFSAFASAVGAVWVINQPGGLWLALLAFGVLALVAAYGVYRRSSWARFLGIAVLIGEIAVIALAALAVMGFMRGLDLGIGQGVGMALVLVLAFGVVGIGAAVFAINSINQIEWSDEE